MNSAREILTREQVNRSTIDEICENPLCTAEIVAKVAAAARASGATIGMMVGNLRAELARKAVEAQAAVSAARGMQQAGAAALEDCTKARAEYETAQAAVAAADRLPDAEIAAKLAGWLETLPANDPRRTLVAKGMVPRSFKIWLRG